jgi:hypothetical protein
MKKLLLTLALITSVFTFIACTTTQKVTNPDGSITETKVFDAAKTERVKRRISTPIKTGVHFLLSKNKTHSAEIAAYIGDARNVFCKMVETKTFSHQFLVDELDKIGTPLLVAKLKDSGDDDLAILIMSGKDGIIGIYDEVLDGVGTVELNAEKWPYQVASLFCEAFSTALKDEGY